MTTDASAAKPCSGGMSALARYRHSSGVSTSTARPAFVSRRVPLYLRSSPTSLRCSRKSSTGCASTSRDTGKIQSLITGISAASALTSAGLRYPAAVSGSPSPSARSSTHRCAVSAPDWSTGSAKTPAVEISAARSVHAFPNEVPSNVVSTSLSAGCSRHVTRRVRPSSNGTPGGRWKGEVTASPLCSEVETIPTMPAGRAPASLSPPGRAPGTPSTNAGPRRRNTRAGAGICRLAPCRR